jgi:hypothetical protein
MSGFIDGPAPLKQTRTFYRSPYTEPSKNYENSKLNMGICTKEYDYVDKSSTALFTDPWWVSRIEQTDRTLGHEARHYERIPGDLHTHEPRTFLINPRRRYPDRDRETAPTVIHIAPPEEPQVIVEQPEEHAVGDALAASTPVQELVHNTESSPVVDAQLENVGSEVPEELPPVVPEEPVEVQEVVTEEAPAEEVTEEVVEEVPAEEVVEEVVEEVPAEEVAELEGGEEAAVAEEGEAAPVEETPAEITPETVESFVFGDTCAIPKVFIVIIIILCTALVFITISAFRSSPEVVTMSDIIPPQQRAPIGFSGGRRPMLRGKAF